MAMGGGGLLLSSELLSLPPTGVGCSTRPISSSLEYGNITLYGKKDVIKDLERCLCWIVTMGPKCHHMYPYEKEAKGLWGQAHRREGNVKTGTESGVMWIQVKG